MASVEAVVVAVVVAPGVGLRLSEKHVAALVVAAAVVAAEAGVLVVVPRGLSAKDRPPPDAVVVTTEVLGTEVETAPRVKPMVAAVVAAGAAAAAAVETGVVKREGAGAGVGWINVGGAGVDEGLIPKANPPPWPNVGAAVEAGWGWDCS